MGKTANVQCYVNVGFSANRTRRYNAAVEGGPFSPKALSDIFKVSEIDPDRLISRESTWLEFKESFSLNAIPQYAKTMAAFANAGGGYIVFGVQNRPHRLVGLHKNDFDQLDPAKLTKGLNDSFSPEISWDSHVHTIDGRRFGLIYTFESNSKPVVAIRSVGPISETDILYRYRGRTERIKYPELRRIIDRQIQRERDNWLETLQQIARIGPNNAAVLDMHAGEIQSGFGKLLVDEKLLRSIRVFYEGKFTEKPDSRSIFRVVGDLQPVRGAEIQPVRTEQRGIHAYDIVEAFLQRKQVENPVEFVVQVAFETSHYYPVYYFIEKAGKTVEEVCREIEQQPTANRTKEKLLHRLRGAEFVNPMGSLSSGSPAAEVKRHFVHKIAGQSLAAVDVTEQDQRYFFEAMTHLGNDDFNTDYLFSLLSQVVLPNYVNIRGAAASALRKALCHLDELIYSGEEVDIT